MPGAAINDFMKHALLGLFIAYLSAMPIHSLAQDSTPPNIILMLIDDMGWMDLGCYGSKYYETPHIDRLAQDGMRFTQAYSACTVCSPTRAAVLTGKSPARLHLTDWIAGHQRPHARLKIPDWTKHLPLEEETLAERLKTRGYATASIGKWHLGGPEFYPQQHGFDTNIGGTDRGQPPSYFSPYGIDTLKDGPKDEFLTDRLTREAIGFIERNKATPFFIYLPHFAVHTPIMGKPEIIAKYQTKRGVGGHSNPVYAALVESVDDSVGQIRATLEKEGLWENTVFIFTSDNGGLSGTISAKGWSRGSTDNSPSRLGKGSAYDGGVHVPLIITWPGKISPGSESDVPVISYDHVPTLLQATGTKLKQGQIVDGESLMPILTQQGHLKRDAIYWHYPHYHPGSATPYSAIQEGDWKLIEHLETGRAELFNHRRDPGEMQDMADIDTDIAQRLTEKLRAWKKEVGAQEPTQNENYDPETAWEGLAKGKKS
jgi:arylsulfatase A